MKVLFSTYTLAFQNPGGGEKVLLKTAEGLRQLGHTVDLYSPWIHDPKNYDIIHYFSSLETGFWQAIRDQCPQTPFFVTPTQWSTGKQNKYKIKRWMEYLQPKWNRTIAYRSLLPTHWFPTTQLEAQSLNQLFNIRTENMSVISNGVENSFFNATPELFRKWSGIEGDITLHVGRFHPVKNQLSLIRAFKAKNIPLVLIGGPDIEHADYYAECLALANVAGSSIRILGPLAMDSEILPSAYAAANSLVLPSEFETFGLAAFEAIAAKIPHIFVTKNCAAKLDLETRVTWIDPHDMEDLALRVQNLQQPNIENKNHSKIKILSWPEIAKKIESNYQNYLI